MTENTLTDPIRTGNTSSKPISSASNEDKRVLMALSGGVDSSVGVRLLQRRGFEVSGLVIRFSPAHEAAVAAARRAAEELGIPLAVAEAEALFEEAVIVPFCAAYAAGRTPNPCVVCNPAVKFRLLAKAADEAGIPYIATGHYARVFRQDGRFFVARAKSARRDQSYMLYRLPQAVLARLLLPAGETEKAAVRQMAGDNGLSSASAPDSQEICFIPDGDYAAYLHRRGITGKQGRFWAPNGADLGPHKGVEHYTVGQRRGLGLSLGRPAFVGSISPEGDVRLAFVEDTLAAGLALTDVLSADGTPLEGEYSVKIRSMARPVPCRAWLDENGAQRVIFGQPQRSPAPGQHAVLYRDELVMGGGVIDAVFKS